ncbi:MAG: hypothetical protein LBB24_01350 [Rickettsiales bacterium]|jgi:glutamine synthetase|nr:hypothetical protein [Rickettsiales bacterium]
MSGEYWLGRVEGSLGDEVAGPSYQLTPPIFFIRNSVARLLERVVGRLGERGYFPKIGLEVEFYASGVDNFESFASMVNDFAGSAGIDYDGTSVEIGVNQFEIGLRPYRNINKLIGDSESLKSFLRESRYGVSFDTMPFYDQARSALQINVTLNDAEGNNLFARGPADEESRIMLNSIAGLLGTTNGFLPLYIKSEEDLLAYDHEFNEVIFARKRNPAPTYNSWGMNNRSCSIRIPTSKNFYSESDYRLDSLLNRRIEFRVAASDCDLSCAMFGVLYGILYGIRNDMEPPPPTSNNVLRHHEGYSRIFIDNNLWDILESDIFND